MAKASGARLLEGPGPKAERHRRTVGPHNKAVKGGPSLLSDADLAKVRTMVAEWAEENAQAGSGNESGQQPYSRKRFTGCPDCQ